MFHFGSVKLLSAHKAILLFLCAIIFSGCSSITSLTDRAKRLPYAPLPAGTVREAYRDDDHLQIIYDYTDDQGRTVSRSLCALLRFRDPFTYDGARGCLSSANSKRLPLEKHSCDSELRTRRACEVGEYGVYSYEPSYYSTFEIYGADGPRRIVVFLCERRWWGYPAKLVVYPPLKAAEMAINGAEVVSIWLGFSLWMLNGEPKELF